MLQRPTPPAFNYPNAESIWLEHRESTRGRDLDITGMSYTMLESAPQQWPLKEGEAQGKARLYEDGIFPTANGRARFVSAEYKPVAEPRSPRYPFALTTGRLRDQWHGMSRTGTVGKLFSHAPEPVLQMHPQDMAQLHLTEGDLVQLSSPRSSLLVPVSSCADVGLRQLFMAMHWGEEFMNGGVNALTSPAFCPDSKQPEFKHTAVKVAKVSLPWNLVAMAWLPSNESLKARHTLQKLMANFKFASCVPFADSSATSGNTSPQTGILFCAAHDSAAPIEGLQTLEAALQLQSSGCLRYTDPKRGQHRVVRIQQTEDQKTLQGFLLAGDTAASAWMRNLLHNQLPIPVAGHSLLNASPQAPSGAVSATSKTVCTCLNVSQSAIEQHLQQCSGTAEERLQSLKSSLQCGTNCGSCIPQLQRMVRLSISL